jgi:hypothetical protein
MQQQNKRQTQYLIHVLLLHSHSRTGTRNCIWSLLYDSLKWPMLGIVLFARKPVRINFIYMITNPLLVYINSCDLEL